jgi:hypothetical protein
MRGHLLGEIFECLLWIVASATVNALTNAFHRMPGSWITVYRDFYRSDFASTVSARKIEFSHHAYYQPQALITYNYPISQCAVTDTIFVSY